MGAGATAAEVAEAMLSFARRESPDQTTPNMSRGALVEIARLTYRAVSQRSATTVAIADEVRAGLETHPQLAGGIAYTSNTMVGHFATTGELLSLSGPLPEVAVVDRILMDIREVGQKVAKTLIRTSPDQATAYRRLRAAAQTIIDARGSRPIADKDADFLEDARRLVARALTQPRSDKGKAIAQGLIATLVSAYSVPAQIVRHRDEAGV